MLKGHHNKLQAKNRKKMRKPLISINKHRKQYGIKSIAKHGTSPLHVQ
jgi:hypothetical protein